jgi:peptidoglycan/LPS O-acetylase OafA/YrhL
MLKPLTSLRFFFALMVFFSHLDYILKSNSIQLKNIYSEYLYEGYIGVSFFFILSGFILSYKYQKLLLSNQISKQKFWLARFARIYPLHLLTLIISIPLIASEWFNNQIKFIIKFFINAGLLQSFFPQQNIHYAFNSPSWSISTEAFFYLLFPFFILRFTLNYKKLIKSVLLILIIAIIIIYTVNDSLSHYIVYVNPFMRSIDFIIGIGLFNIYNFINTKKINIYYNLIEVTSLILLVIFFLFHNRIPQVFRYSAYYWLPMSAIILAYAFQGGVISKLLSHKLLIISGEISYGFYMFHQLIIRYFSKITKLEDHIIETSISIFIITLIISYFSHQYFEKPVNSFLRNIKLN